MPALRGGRAVSRIAHAAERLRTRRKTSKQPTDRAVDQINDVIADFTECQPKVAHSNTELTSRLGEYSTQINAGSGDARGEPYRRIGVSASDERSAFTVRRRSRKRSVLLCFFKAEQTGNGSPTADNTRLADTLSPTRRYADPTRSPHPLG